jgi:hypothetical protein
MIEEVKAKIAQVKERLKQIKKPAKTKKSPSGTSIPEGDFFAVCGHLCGQNFSRNYNCP